MRRRSRRIPNVPFVIIPPQGVLPKQLVLTSAAVREKRTPRAGRFWPNLRLRNAVPGTVFRENSPKQHGAMEILTILRLARAFTRPSLRMTKGRDRITVVAEIAHDRQYKCFHDPGAQTQA